MNCDHKNLYTIKLNICSFCTMIGRDVMTLVDLRLHGCVKTTRSEINLVVFQPDDCEICLFKNAMLDIIELPLDMLILNVCFSGIWTMEMLNGSNRPMKSSSLWRRKTLTSDELNSFAIFYFVHCLCVCHSSCAG